jgi:hypothetical protein
MENNDLIAEFMGYEKVTVGYFGTDDETEWQKEHDYWMFDVGLTEIGDYYVNVPKKEFYKIENMELWYGEWNKLMNVIEKIENMGYEVSIINNECEIGEDVDAEHYVGLVCKQEKYKITSVYSAIVEFINWYNNKEKKL